MVARKIRVHVTSKQRCGCGFYFEIWAIPSLTYQEMKLLKGKILISVPFDQYVYFCKFCSIFISSEDYLKLWQKALSLRAYPHNFSTIKCKCRSRLFRWEIGENNYSTGVSVFECKRCKIVVKARDYWTDQYYSWDYY